MSEMEDGWMFRRNRLTMREVARADNGLLNYFSLHKINRHIKCAASDEMKHRQQFRISIMDRREYMRNNAANCSTAQK